MSSVKCPSCGLVNFSTSIQCKRCQHLFNELAPIAANRTYQAPTQNFQPYQMPPPPPVFHDNQHQPIPSQNQPINCIKCGTKNNLNLQTFKKLYIPPAINAAAIAPLLYLILISFFKVTHKITAPFCNNCWGKYNNGKIAEMVGGGLALVLAIGAVPVFVFFDSIIGFMGCFISAILIFIIGHVYKESSSPKFKKIDSQQVVIVSPVDGEMCFQK